MFQVAGKTASRVSVKVIGPDGGDDIIDGKLDSGRPLIVQGNYQLSDNATVRESDTP